MVCMGTAEGAKKGWTAERRARQSQQQKEVWDEKKRAAHSELMREKTMNQLTPEQRSERVRKGHTPESDARRSVAIRATLALPDRKHRNRKSKSIMGWFGYDGWRLILNTYKMTLGCRDCGYRAHPLALECDHVPERGDRLFTISGAASRPLVDLIAELEKCDVVCANCHRVRTAARARSTVTPA